MMSWARWGFAFRYAGAHFLGSLFVALIAAIIVFGGWYADPWWRMQQVGNIYLLVLTVDVVCGPLLTLILAHPEKSRRELRLDLTFVTLIQVLALIYGMHSVWAARPAALVFEVDRIVLVTANEIESQNLAHAPSGMQQLSQLGALINAGTRRPHDGEEMIRSLDLSLAGISPAQRPDWWLPWGAVQDAMRKSAKPLADLINRNPESALSLYAAAQRSEHDVQKLSYLPLVSSKTLQWVVLLDVDLKMVGYVQVDGF